MLAVKLPENIEHRLEAFTQKTGISPDKCVWQAIEDFLDYQEDCSDFVDGLKDIPNAKPLSEVEKMLGLDL